MTDAAKLQLALVGPLGSIGGGESVDRLEQLALVDGAAVPGGAGFFRFQNISPLNSTIRAPSRGQKYH